MASGGVWTEWPIAASPGFGLAIVILDVGFAILDLIRLGLLVQPIEARFYHFDRSIGRLQRAAFAPFKALEGGPMGALADPAGRAALVALEITVRGIASIAFGLSGGIAKRLVVRTVVEIEEAAPRSPRASADGWVVLWV